MHIIIDPDHMEMVFPDAVDLKVIFREAFIDKMVVFQDFERRYIFRHDISFNTMEMKILFVRVQILLKSGDFVYNIQPPDWKGICLGQQV